jgi:hypothetical protein
MNPIKTQFALAIAAAVLAADATQGSPLGPLVVNPVNHHSYQLLQAATWKDSEKEAVSMGGHLATIRNASEEAWIVRQFGSYGDQQRLLWIGLTDSARKSHFSWSSGESLSYTCWAEGEPNNAGRGEDFVAIYYPGHSQGGKWNDWNDRIVDPIGLPMNGVVEIVASDVASATVNPGAVSAASVVTINPLLVITNDAGSVKLQWPVSVSTFLLESTTNMSQPFTMFGYSETTNSELGVISVTITNPGAQMFFRLRKP